MTIENPFGHDPFGSPDLGPGVTITPQVSNEPVKEHPGAIQNSGITEDESTDRGVLVPVMTKEETETNTPSRGKRMALISAPAGVSQSSFRAILSNAYALVVTIGSYDTDTIAKRTNLNTHIVSKALASPQFARALELRGITPNATGLTSEQDHALLSLTDPYDRRTMAQKLKSLGISNVKYRGWLKQPLFKQQVDAMTADLLQDNMPGMVQLQRLAGDGDLKAIQYLHQLNGTFDPNRNQVIDLMAFMSSVIDILSRHVTDQTVLSNVANDMNQLANTVKGRKQIGE